MRVSYRSALMGWFGKQLELESFRNSVYPIFEAWGAYQSALINGTCVTGAYYLIFRSFQDAIQDVTIKVPMSIDVATHGMPASFEHQCKAPASSRAQVFCKHMC